jgi:hypothetical protein
MTREEGIRAKREEYLRSRNHRLEYQRKYDAEHHEAIRQRQRVYRERRKAGITPETTYQRPSTDEFEQLLPLGLKLLIPRIREAYLSIHITRRPVYDYYLRCMTVNYQKEHARERKQLKSAATV